MAENNVELAHFGFRNNTIVLTNCWPISEDRGLTIV